MATVEITAENALKAYDEGTDQDKALLGRLLGKGFFTRDIKDRVKTYEDACKVLNLNPAEQLPCPTDLNGDFASINAYTKLIIIARALNEGWRPNWSNTNEYKYYPWMKYAGSGFSFGDYVYVSSRSAVGSRLVFKSKDLAEYAGTQFQDIYNEFFLL